MGGYAPVVFKFFACVYCWVLKSVYIMVTLQIYPNHSVDVR
jgi:hypothetical protein